MSANGRLGPRKQRQVEAVLGEHVHMAFAHGYHRSAVTPDDRHIWLDRDGTVELIEDPCHWTTCPSVLVSYLARPMPWLTGQVDHSGEAAPPDGA